MATSREDANVILSIMNGGKLNLSETGPTEELVMRMMLQVRDYLMEQDIRKTEKQQQPETSYYTDYDEGLPILWDETRQWCYIELPGGNPTDVLNGMGIRISPVRGQGGNYVYAKRGWCDNNPEISWAEGNWVYELYRGRVIFPTMPQGEVLKVAVSVIETGKLDPDKALPMPTRYSMLVRNQVLEDMGHGKRDMVTNYNREAQP